MSDAFKVVGRERLLSCFAFTVERRTVSSKDGEFSRDIASHNGAVAVVAQRPDGCIALLRQYRAAFDAEIWEIPAGTLDVAGEEPLSAAKRELLEEVGCSSTEWSALGTFMVSPGWTDQLMHLFLATNVSLMESQPSGPEESAMTIHWKTLDEIRNLIASGESLDYSLSMGLARCFGDLVLA